jgi:CheY-like chemotaxis protein
LRDRPKPRRWPPQHFASQPGFEPVAARYLSDVDTPTRFRILVADDEPAMLQTLREILEDSGYDVLTAVDGVEALDLLGRETVHALISDISMPRMDGLELLGIAGDRWPSVPRILLTGNLLDEYIGRFLDQKISCVLVKNIPFPVKEILNSLETLLNPEFSWIDQSFPVHEQRVCHRLFRPADINTTLDTLSELLPAHRRKPMRLVLQELLTNAMFYGARNEDGSAKDTWSHDFELPPDQAIEVEWIEDADKVGVCVRDHGGKLDSHTILHWLERQTRKDEFGVPIGALDIHGRGLFFSRIFSDRMIVNIRSGKRTEVLSINWRTEPPVGQKPLLIFQI